jgi:hypothetical protein
MLLGLAIEDIIVPQSKQIPSAEKQVMLALAVDTVFSSQVRLITLMRNGTLRIC